MIRISDMPLEPEREVRVFREALNNEGAIVSFTGIVRDSGGTDSLSLTYYPGYTERVISTFVEEAKRRWSLRETLILHRVGRMLIGDPIVVVASAALHRRAAFESCDFLMDKLKSEAPFWKQETIAGQSRWVEPRAEDNQDLKRWS